MAKEIRNYLTKQLFVEKNIVTFRSLSRQFKIHVNEAKNELDTYHQNPEPSSGPTHATYLLSGQLSSTQTNGDAMDVDEDVTPQEEDGEQAQELRVTLVGEQDLESVKSTYARIFSQHIYCLSPSAVIDAGLICAPSDKVHETDAKLKQDEAATLGRVIGPHVQKGKPVPHIALAKAKEPFSRKPTGPVLKTTKPKEEPVQEENPKEPEKPVKAKQAGVLDWSKAKPKQSTKTEEKKSKVEEKKPKEEEEEPEKSKKAKAEPPAKPAAKVKEEKKEEKLPKEKPAPGKAVKATEPKRGVKRKSALKIDSDSDEEADTKPSSREKTPEKPQAKAGPKLKKLVVVSDEDDDSEPIAIPKAAPKGKPRPKPKVIDSDDDDDEIPSKAEASLRAMMDIDDDDVIRVSRHGSRATSVPTSPEPEPGTEAETRADASSDGDVEMADSDLDVKPKQTRKRKEKKVVPVGKNGRKKKRVIKSRRERDAKGFLVTVDYSEYESVDDDVPEEEPPAKPATKGKKPAKDKGEPKEPKKVIRPGRPLKRSGSSAGSKGGQGSLMNFFGKK